MEKKLLVPFKVSSGKNGSAIGRGTRAFVEKGTDISAGAKIWLRTQKKIHRMGKTKKSRAQYKCYFERPWSGLFDAISKVALERRRIAEKSDFYVKPVTATRKEIRRQLLSKGVPVEVPIQDLGNGLELFAKENYERIPKDTSNPDNVKKQKRDILARMHDANVSHNHLHSGNFVMNPHSKIKLIDLSRAKLYSRPPRTKREFLRRYARDIFFVARSLALTGERYSLPSQKQIMWKNIEKESSTILASYKNNFGVTFKEIKDAAFKKDEA